MADMPEFFRMYKASIDANDGYIGSLSHWRCSKSTFDEMYRLYMGGVEPPAIYDVANPATVCGLPITIDENVEGWELRNESANR